MRVAPATSGVFLSFFIVVTAEVTLPSGCTSTFMRVVVVKVASMA